MRMMNRIRRALSLGMRQASFSMNAARLGFLFLRARWFRMPQEIRVGGRRLSLSYPPEAGVQNDFIACVIRDEYGLGRELSGLRTIVDVGANVGFFSLAARHRWPRATIHAYEPNPRVFQYLRSNTSALGIEIHPEALGAQDGFTSIFDSGDSNQARTSGCEGGEIPQVTLSHAIERIGGTVDLLKLDCEGAEWDLFQAADAWRRVRNLRMEYHLFHGETIPQLESTLQALGFKVIRLEPGPGFGILWATASN